MGKLEKKENYVLGDTGEIQERGVSNRSGRSTKVQVLYHCPQLFFQQIMLNLRLADAGLDHLLVHLKYTECFLKIFSK